MCPAEARAQEGGFGLDAPKPSPRPIAWGPRIDPREARRARLAPPRTVGHRFFADFQPFASETVAGLLVIPEWLYRGPGGLWIRGRLGPLGYVVADADRFGVVDSSLLVGWENRLFAVGAGTAVGYARIEEERRRGEGFAPATLGRVRLGALCGLHFALELGWLWVEQEPIFGVVRIRFRVPLREGRLFDLEIAAASYSWAYGLVAVELPLTGGWRIRPHLGFTELIDPVGRDGGPGGSVGTTFVYRLDE